MAERKRIAGWIVSLVVIVGAGPFLYGLFATPNDPALVFQDGLPAEIVNCEAPPPEKAYRCQALYCEKALYERKLVRPYVRVSVPRHQHKFSDEPERSVHFATWTHEDRAVVARCEMKRYEVVSIEFLERMPK